jgi:protein-S-isoprenylcysteine O-methyltransferase Ste14
VRSARIPALGRRGEGWVAAQTVALAALAVCAAGGPGWPGAAEPWVLVGGVALGAAGASLAALGALALGRALTPLPRPRDEGALRDTGVYRHARHPIYGGLLLVGAGVSLACSPLALLPTAALLAVFELKSRREELWLSERYPGYARYRERTSRRFLPWVL